MNNKEEDWLFPRGGNWKDANLESLKILKAELDQQIKTDTMQFTRFQDRVFKYLGFLIPSTIGACAYLFSLPIQDPENAYWIFAPFFILLCGLIYVIGICLYILKAKVFGMPGLKGSQLDNEDYYYPTQENQYLPDEQTKAMLIGIIELNQFRTQRNDGVLAEKKDLLQRVILHLLYAIGLAVGVGIILALTVG